MNDTQTLNRKLERIAWGAIFIWWGITELFTFPNGTDALGFGLILLSVNAARSLNGIPINGFSITLGILALVWSGLDLTQWALHLPFKLPVFAILLIALGVILLAGVLLRVRETGLQRS